MRENFFAGVALFSGSSTDKLSIPCDLNEQPASYIVMILGTNTQGGSYTKLDAANFVKTTTTASNSYAVTLYSLQGDGSTAFAMNRLLTKNQLTVYLPVLADGVLKIPTDGRFCSGYQYIVIAWDKMSKYVQ